MAGIRPGGQPVKNRQREARGLAGTGLGGAQQVFAGEDDGDGLRLDGGGNGVTLLGDSAEQLGRQAEFCKSANDYLLMIGPGRTQPSTPVQADTLS